MSGTSLDAVDAALIQTDGERIYAFGPAIERRYTSEERAVLQVATQAARAWNWQGPQPEAAFEQAHEVILKTHEQAWNLLISKAGQTKIDLVGVHGQTVLHRRPTASQKGATLQLMRGADLAQILAVNVISDFRTADVLAGGEGAPLAPAYHQALLAQWPSEPSVVLNLGGVANITAVFPDGEIIAFDTGPANGPIDEWVEGHEAGHYDVGGQLAAAGSVHTGLLAQMMDHPWFEETPPKSLDRYDFSASLVRGLSLEDGAATLTAFSAAAVAAGLDQLPQRPKRVIACGGGRHNPSLLAALKARLACPVLTAEQVGWRGDSIEAEAFAFLAARSLRNLPLSWPGTTGVVLAQTGGELSRY